MVGVVENNEAEPIEAILEMMNNDWLREE